VSSRASSVFDAGYWRRVLRLLLEVQQGLFLTVAELSKYVVELLWLKHLLRLGELSR